MQILVVNCGSSSVKAEVIDLTSGKRVIVMSVDRISDAQPKLKFSDSEEVLSCPSSGHDQALSFAFPLLINKLDASLLRGVGHRIVHGGKIFDEPVIITEDVEKQIDELKSLAPLHNPINLLGVKIAKKFFPDVPHVAVFDTAFHSTIPAKAKNYALPKNLIDKHHIERYGFHGTSHQYVAQQAADYLGVDIHDLRIISCHLGNGASVCAIEHGQSVETSMGMTPLEGLVMGTRSGDVDAGIITYLMEKEGKTWQEISDMLNKDSGMKGIAGSNDMRDLEEKAAEGDINAQLAIEMFVHRLRKYIGSYAAVMGGADVLIFTAGIGENSTSLRHKVVQKLNFMRAILDDNKNKMLKFIGVENVEDISASNSLCKILVVKTDEQLAIAEQSAKLIKTSKLKDQAPRSIPIAVSARHIHLTQESVDILFGKGYQLTAQKPLSQPGQYACNEMLTIVGPKNKIEKVRILGPTRPKDQVEISRTDEFFLGIDAPIRESGHVEGSPGLTLIGPNGKLDLKEGVICAWRHIHMHPDDAEYFGVKDKDIVEIRIENQERGLTFGNVLIRVSEKFKLEMHIDTDEANAAELNQGAEGSLMLTNAGGMLTKKKIG
ncbi:MAG: acetate/propionate family kinase [Raineya sp.]|jgi:acetate kinase|nr:acetate/propionate family kinase [Raineya sp.]